MHQHTIVGYIIGMIVLDLEVIDLDRAFEQLVLDFFDDNIFAVDQNENIPRPEFAGLCPALDRRIERMSRRCNDFFAVCPDMNQLVRLVDVGFDNLSFCLRRGKSPAETCSAPRYVLHRCLHPGSAALPVLRPGADQDTPWELSLIHI